MQRKNGKVMVTDGPFVETKELIGSVFLIEAKHQNIQGRGLQ
ncbi:YciI family protein [Cytobacillus citreus]